ncbi:hypothetical protein [Enterobacter sp. Lyrl_3]|uniref:hypothetical protein n=1 Tax=Enterobacter sp. Lyrl_3 TaxID=3110922 RepID=UPI003F7CF32E
MEEIAIQFSRDLRLVFENTHDELDKMGIPFFYSFPTNSCQGASVYLGLFLKWLSPKSRINVVKGSHRTRGEHHYWVEFNGRVYDLTNDQFESWLGERFEGVGSPVYASRKHPLRSYFFYKKKTYVIDAYATFCSYHANTRDVHKAQWFIVDKLRELGWEVEHTIEGNKFIKIK